jgi:hypothetical protein
MPSPLALLHVSGAVGNPGVHAISLSVLCACLYPRQPIAAASRLGLGSSIAPIEVLLRCHIKAAGPCMTWPGRHGQAVL